MFGRSKQMHQGSRKSLAFLYLGTAGKCNSGGENSGWKRQPAEAKGKRGIDIHDGK